MPNTPRVTFKDTEWGANWLQGSLNGLEFFTRSTSTVGGQRKATWELPFDSNGAVSRDLGATARRFSIEAFFVGNSHIEKAKAFLEACEKPGEAVLVHPVFGSVSVVIDPEITLDIDGVVGGISVVKFSCVRGRNKTNTLKKLSPKNSLVTNHAKALVDIRKAVKRDLQMSGVRDYVADANLKTLNTVITDLHKMNSTIGSILAVPSNFASKIDSIARSVAQLINTPGELFDALHDAIFSIVNSVNFVADAITDGANTRIGDDNAAVLGAVGISSAALSQVTYLAGKLGSDPEPLPTTKADAKDRVDETRNHAAIKHAVRASALLSVVAATSEATFDSSDSARQIKDQVSKAILDLTTNLIAGIEIDDIVRGELLDARSLLNQHINSLELVDLKQYTPGATMSTYEIAYELYGDATRADELEARNTIPHPGFVSTTIEVASV